MCSYFVPNLGSRQISYIAQGLWRPHLRCVRFDSLIERFSYPSELRRPFPTERKRTQALYEQRVFFAVINHQLIDTDQPGSSRWADA